MSQDVAGAPLRLVVTQMFESGSGERGSRNATTHLGIEPPRQGSAFWCRARSQGVALDCGKCGLRPGARPQPAVPSACLTRPFGASRTAVAPAT